MKYKVIEIPLYSERKSSEEVGWDLENFCKGRGYKYSKIVYGEKLGGFSSIKITLENKYNSGEVRELIAVSQEQQWERGEAISRSSENVIEAYRKALKESQEQRARFSEKKMSKAEEKLYKDLIRFREFLKNRIVRKVMEQYSRIEEKL